MKVILLPPIFYEIAVDRCDGTSYSKFFTSKNFIRSRERALSFFLETALSDEALDKTPCFVTVFLRHLKTGRRIEIMNSAIFEDCLDSLSSLEEELQFYRREGAQVETAIWCAKQPHMVTFVRPYEEKPEGTICKYGSEFIANNYWLFIKARNERYLSA